MTDQHSRSKYADSYPKYTLLCVIPDSDMMFRICSVIRASARWKGTRRETLTQVQQTLDTTYALQVLSYSIRKLKPISSVGLGRSGRGIYTLGKGNALLEIPS
jgi:hypothetical protein